MAQGSGLWSRNCRRDPNIGTYALEALIILYDTISHYVIINLLLTIEWFIYWQLLNALINPSCNQEAIEGGGPFCGKEPHPQRPQPSCTLFSNKPIVDTSLRTPCPRTPSILAREHEGGQKTERLIGNEVWRTRDASPPPHYPAGSAGGRSRKQVANRRLPSGSSSLGLPELKKNIYTPNLLHPTLGLTEVRVWFERHRPVLSPSMASWIKFGLIN